MLLKFIKAELKQQYPYTHKINITISVSSSENPYAIKKPRKIRKKIANFYGETVQLLEKQGQFLICVEKIEQSLPQIQLLIQVAVDTALIEHRSHQKNMVNQNQYVKLTWAYSFPDEYHSNMISRKSSGISMDLEQFQMMIPQKQPTARQNFKIYSPIHPKRRHIRQLYRELNNQIGQSSPEDNHENSSQSKPKISKQDFIKMMKIPLKSASIDSNLKISRKSHQKFRKTNSSSINLKKISISPNKNKVNKSQNRNQKSRKKVLSQINKVYAFSACAIGAATGLIACFIDGSY